MNSGIDGAERVGEWDPDLEILGWKIWFDNYTTSTSEDCDWGDPRYGSFRDDTTTYRHLHKGVLMVVVYHEYHDHRDSDTEGDMLYKGRRGCYKGESFVGVFSTPFYTYMINCDKYPSPYPDRDHLALPGGQIGKVNCTEWRAVKAKILAEISSLPWGVRLTRSN